MATPLVEEGALAPVSKPRRGSVGWFRDRTSSFLNHRRGWFRDRTSSFLNHRRAAGRGRRSGRPRWLRKALWRLSRNQGAEGGGWPARPCGSREDYRVSSDPPSTWITAAAAAAPPGRRGCPTALRDPLRPEDLPPPAVRGHAPRVRGVRAPGGLAAPLGRARVRLRRGRDPRRRRSGGLRRALPRDAGRPRRAEPLLPLRPGALGSRLRHGGGTSGRRRAGATASRSPGRRPHRAQQPVVDPGRRTAGDAARRCCRTRTTRCPTGSTAPGPSRAGPGWRRERGGPERARRVRAPRRRVAVVGRPAGPPCGGRCADHGGHGDLGRRLDEGARSSARRRRILGAGEPRMLGYADARVPDSAPGRPRLLDAPVDEVVARIVAHVRELRPEIVVTHDRARRGHRSPRTTCAPTRSAVRAARAAGDPRLHPEAGEPWTPGSCTWPPTRTRRDRCSPTPSGPGRPCTPRPTTRPRPPT